MHVLESRSGGRFYREEISDNVECIMWKNIPEKAAIASPIGIPARAGCGTRRTSHNSIFGLNIVGGRRMGCNVIAKEVSETNYHRRNKDKAHNQFQHL